MFKRLISHNFAALYPEGYAGQELPARWTKNTFPSVRLKGCTVCCAQDVASIFSQELIVDPVHRHRHMGAAVDVSEILAAIIHQETFCFPSLNRQQKFLCLSATPYSDVSRHAVYFV